MKRRGLCSGLYWLLLPLALLAGECGERDPPNGTRPAGKGGLGEPPRVTRVGPRSVERVARVAPGRWPRHVERCNSGASGSPGSPRPEEPPVAPGSAHPEPRCPHP